MSQPAVARTVRFAVNGDTIVAEVEPRVTLLDFLRDRHLQLIAERGRIGWQKTTGYTARAKAEAAVSRYKRVIGDALRSRTDDRQATEVAIAVRALNRMLELGRPESVRIA